MRELWVSGWCYELPRRRLMAVESILSVQALQGECNLTVEKVRVVFDIVCECWEPKECDFNPRGRVVVVGDLFEMDQRDFRVDMEPVSLLTVFGRDAVRPVVVVRASEPISVGFWYCGRWLFVEEVSVNSEDI